MIEYRVLSGASAKSLEEQVVDLAKEGYIPQGGVVTCYIGSQLFVGDGHEDAQAETILFSQAMVKVVKP